MNTDELLKLLVGKVVALSNDVAGTDGTVANLQLAVERLSEQITDLAARPDPECWVSASEIANYTGKSQQWVKEHGGDLGGVRDGKGKTAAWLFKRSLVDAGLAALGRPPAPPAQFSPRRRQRDTDAADLLPIHGRNAA